MSAEYLFNGLITYMYSVYTDFDRDMDAELRRDLMIHRIRARFDDAVVDTDPDALEEPLLKDIHIVQNFLHGDGLPFDCTRIVIRDFKLSFEKFPVAGTGVIISLFPEFNTVQIMFCFKFNQLSTDQLIYLRQIFAGSSPFHNEKDGSSAPLSGHYQRIADCFRVPIHNIELMYLLEIRKTYPDIPYEQFIHQESRRIYGLISGDEGWEYVPENMAENRLSNSWGSRKFVTFFAFGNNAVLFNMIDSNDGKRYLERQTSFGTLAYGSPNEYFFLKSDAAGVCHGIFFGQETIMVIKTIAANIMERQATRKLSRQPSLRNDLRLTKEFRAELITTINKVENLGISEIGELEQMLIHNFKISPLIENIKYLLEMLESDLDLLYQQDTNRKVNMLTFIGLLISGIGLILSFIEFF